MQRVLKGGWVLASISCLVCCEVLSAEEPKCVEIAAMARMARATSPAQLTAAHLEAGNDYRAQIVFASRSLELHPGDRRIGTLLLNLIPGDDGQQAVWMTLGDSLCETESITDMRSLGRLRDNLPRDLAKAALIVPGKLTEYVSYSIISVQDPHSDYAIQMKRVCRAEHAKFLKAVDSLASDKRDRFLKHIFNPDGCHALAFPEAE